MLPSMPRFARLVDLIRFTHSQPEGGILTSTGDTVDFASTFAPCRHADGTVCHWPDWSAGGETLGRGSVLPLCIHGKATIYRLVGIRWSWLTAADIFGPHAV